MLNPRTGTRPSHCKRGGRMTFSGESITALKGNFDHMSKKIDKLWEEREKVPQDSEEYVNIEREIARIEANRRRIAEKLKAKGNDDPAYF